MKIRNIEASQSTKKSTKPRKRSRKSRGARTKSNRKRRRRLRAALSHNPGSSKPLESSSLLPKLFSKPKFSPRQGSAAMSGNWYWLNYFNVFQWKDRYLSNNGVTPYSLPGLNGWPLEERHSLPESIEGCTSRLQPTASCCKSVDTSVAPEYNFSHEDVDEEDVAGYEDSDEDIEVTEELMQFLEISMRHRASRNVKKEEPKNQEESAFEPGRNDSEDCQVPSDQANDEKRNAEMALLYGEKAPMIHGMETALQLTFNRQVDLFNPPYWPIHPFTMQFKS